MAGRADREQRVRLTAENPDLFRVQRLIRQGRQRAAEIRNGDVQLAVNYRPLKLRGRVHENVQMHVVFTLIKARNGGIDPSCRQRRDIVRQPQIQIPHQPPGKVLGFIAKRIHGPEQHRRGLKNALAFFGHAKAAFAALTNAVAQTFFQPGNVRADVRLAHVQLSLSRRKPTTFDHRGEDAQQAQIHVRNVSDHRDSRWEWAQD